MSQMPPPLVARLHCNEGCIVAQLDEKIRTEQDRVHSFDVSVSQIYAFDSRKLFCYSQNFEALDVKNLSSKLMN